MPRSCGPGALERVGRDPTAEVAAGRRNASRRCRRALGGGRISVFKAGGDSHGWSNESILVEDGELVHRRLPVMSSTAPIGSDVAQCQPDELRSCLICREVSSGLDDLAQRRGADRKVDQP